MEVQQTVQEWSFGSARVRWGSLLAALVVSIAAQILLTVFGLAVGLSSFDVRAEGQGVSIGTGVWTGISLIVSIGLGASWRHVYRASPCDRTASTMASCYGE